MTLQKRQKKTHKAKTGVGDGFHEEVPLDLAKETKREVAAFLEKVEQCGKWPQQACTTMFCSIVKNIASERPIALMPSVIRRWEALRAPEVARFSWGHHTPQHTLDPS